MSPFFGTKLAHSNRCSGFTNDFSRKIAGNDASQVCLSQHFFALHCQRVEPTAKGCSEWYYPKARLRWSQNYGHPRIQFFTSNCCVLEEMCFDWFCTPQTRKFSFLKVKQLWHSVSIFIVGSINGWIWKITPTVTIKSRQRLQQTKYEHN